jgi:cytochrome P450
MSEETESQGAREFMPGQATAKANEAALAQDSAARQRGTTQVVGRSEEPVAPRAPGDPDWEAAEAVLTELLFAPEGRSDPYPRYEKLRSLDSAHQSQLLGGWALVGYDDVNAALRDPRLGRRYGYTNDLLRPGWELEPSLVHLADSLLMVDGEVHSHLRRAVARSFTPKTVAALRPKVEQVVAELAAPLLQAGEGDMLDAIGYPLPAEVIAVLLGVPSSDIPTFRQWARDLVATLELGASEEEIKRANAADAAFRDYFIDLLALKRRKPADDLLSALVATEGQEEGLSALECVNVAMQLFVAGFETTTNTIGNAAIALASQPEQISLLHEAPENYSHLSDEILRFCGPVHVLARRAFEPTVLNGHIPVREDEFVLVFPAAANRDPSQFPSPQRLDLTRRDVRPVSFGGGLHYCVGAALARLEIEVCFRYLLDRIEAIELTGETPFLDRLTLVGPRALPVRLVPRKDSRAKVAMSSQRLAQISEPKEASYGQGGVLVAREQAEACPLAPSGVLEGIVATLATAPFFATAGAEVLRRLAETAYGTVFRPGEMLMAQGASSPNCYVIQEGEVEVSRSGEIVAVLGAGDVVGEMGVLFGSSRSASVKAVSDVVALSLSAKRLLEIGQENPRFLESMKEMASQRGMVSA